MLRRNLDTLAAALHACGITHWTVSPGSRNAPIVAGFLRHGGFTLHSFPDERSAAFAAMGMSQGLGYPCGVICTSGTASLNLYPAICEAYYQRIPLIALTADRPASLIDQWDGQVIRQKNVFEKHILDSYETPQNIHALDCEQEIVTLIRTAVQQSIEPVKGPVHINVPLTDPIYQDIDRPFAQPKSIKPLVFHKTPHPKQLPQEVYERLLASKKILFVSGQNLPDAGLMAASHAISNRFPLIADITSNLGGAGIARVDNALHCQTPNPELAADCLITFGLSVLSKPLKKFIQKHPPAYHLHLSTGGFTGDPFLSKPETLFCEPAEILDILAIQLPHNAEYFAEWTSYAADFEDQHYSKDAEYAFIKDFFKHCEPSTSVHLGNSMTVRYASLAGNPGYSVFCNRGTSGIDGSLSTAVGYALAHPEKKVFCILGDISFFYDLNGLWTSKLPENLGIVIQNNFGGKIFHKIDGPSTYPDMLPLITTPHKRSVQHAALDFNIPFYNMEGSAAQATDILNLPTPFICEIRYATT